ALAARVDQIEECRESAAELEAQSTAPADVEYPIDLLTQVGGIPEAWVVYLEADCLRHQSSSVPQFLGLGAFATDGVAGGVRITIRKDAKSSIRWPMAWWVERQVAGHMSEQATSHFFVALWHF